MEFGIKKIRVLLHNDTPSLSATGEVINRVSELYFSGEGDSIVERVNGVSHPTTKRLQTINSTDIDRINLNMATYCLAKGMNSSDLFKLGEKQLREAVNLTKVFPIEKMAILRDNGTTVENVTTLCKIDKIDGSVEIPLALDTGLFSFIYTVKRVEVENKTFVQIPQYQNSGVNILTV